MKSESESGIHPPKSSPHEVRRKLSLLEEKRAIFQRRLFETTRDIDSRETVIAVTVDEDDRHSAKEEEKREESTKKRARHISVKKFDTFSTFEGTFDEETGVGYLAGIEEDYTESYDRQNDEYPGLPTTMGPMVGTSDSAEKSKVASQDSMVRLSKCSPFSRLGYRVSLLANVCFFLRGSADSAHSALMINDHT